MNYRIDVILENGHLTRDQVARLAAGSSACPIAREPKSLMARYFTCQAVGFAVTMPDPYSAAREAIRLATGLIPHQSVIYTGPRPTSQSLPEQTVALILG